MTASELEAQELREFVHWLTDREARGVIVRLRPRASRPAEPSSIVPEIAYSVDTPQGNLMVYPYKEGWSATDVGQDGSIIWTTVNEATDPAAAPQIIDIFLAPDGPSLEARFACGEERHNVVPSPYERKLYETNAGLVGFHLRPHPNGREHVMEIPDCGQFVVMLWDRTRGSIDLAAAEITTTPPAWVDPLWIGAPDKEAAREDTASDAGGSVARLDKLAAMTLPARTRPALASRVHGLYLAHAAVPQMHLSRQETGKAFHRYTDMQFNEDGSFRRWGFKHDAAFTYDEVSGLLVREHERQHYQQLMSTPLGLLLWRSYNAVSASIAWVLQTLNQKTGLAIDRLPLDAWYEGGGREQVTTALASTDVPIQRFERILQDALTVDRFIDALLDGAALTVGEFVDLANAAMVEILRASNLPGELLWTSQRGRSEPLLPEGAFSAVEIVEAAARFEELMMLRSAREAGARVEATWRERSLHGVYRPAFMHVENRLHDVRMCRIALDLAMLGPADPVAAAGETIVVEQVLPGLRLSAILDAMEATIWDYDVAEEDRLLLDSVVERAGLPSVRGMLETALQRPIIGEFSWGADALLLGAKPEDTIAELFDHVASEVRRAFDLRLQDPAMLVGRPGQRFFFRPLFEIWADEIHINDDPKAVQIGAELFQKGLSMLVCNIAALALLSDGDVRQIGRLQSALNASRVVRNLPSAKDDLLELARIFVGHAACHLLAWA